MQFIGRTALAAAALAAVVAAPIVEARPAAAHELDAHHAGEKLIDISDAAVYGVVGPSQSVPSTLGVEVDTLTTVAVTRPLKGNPGRTLTIRTPGGQLPDGTYLGFAEEGDPLVEGDEVLLFLDAQGADGSYRRTRGAAGVVKKRNPTPDGSVPNPRFSRPPESLTTAPADCGDNTYPPQAGYSGFHLLANPTSGVRVVWNTTGFTMMVNTNYTAYAAAFAEAVNTWNAGGGSFTIQPGGTTTASPNTRTDNINTIGWGSITTSNALGSAPYRHTADGQLLEVDIVMNQARQSALSTSPSSTQYDIIHVMLHELGHNLGFGHQTNANAVMSTCTLAAGDNTRRSLWAGELAGHKNFYPPNRLGLYLLDESGAVYGLGGYGSFNKLAARYYGGANQNNVLQYPTYKATDIEVAKPTRNGYHILGSKGHVYAYGGAKYKGGATSWICPSCTATDMATHPTGDFYWILGSDGGVFGLPQTTAPYYGNPRDVINGPAMGIAATPDGGGYWVVSDKGNVYAFGNAPFHGGGIPSWNWPARGIEGTQDGQGYWVIGNDGTVYEFNAPPAYMSGNAPARKLSRDPHGGGLVSVSSPGYTKTSGFTDYGWGTTSAPYVAAAATRVAVSPTLTLSSSTSSMTARRGQTSSTTVTVSSNETFYASVGFTVSGAPSGIAASVSPSSVMLPWSSSRSATLNVTPATTYAGPSSFSLTVNACGQDICRSQQITVVIAVV